MLPKILSKTASFYCEDREDWNIEKDKKYVNDLMNNAMVKAKVMQ